jgi:5-methyltetrahydropteroyltriglutamate--homocysteine methyltransferase
MFVAELTREFYQTKEALAEDVVALLKAELAELAQLVLEYATDRAGDLMSFGGKELGLGVVNPRSDVVESTGAICAAVEEALCFYVPGRISLNPDCGFGTFANRPMNTWEVAAAKVGAMVAAARELRGG